MPPGERRVVAVALHERLGVEHDEPAQVGAADAGPDRAAQLALDLLGRPARRRARSTRRRSGHAGPRRPSASRCRRPPAPGSPAASPGPAGRPGPGAQHRALGAVDDVALGGAHVPGEHELLLDDVLNRLDRHVGGVQRLGALGDPAGDAGGRSRIGRERQERLADRRLDLGRAPRHDVAGAADQPQRPGGSSTGRAGQDALDDQRLGHLVVAGVDQRRLDERGEVGGRDDGLAQGGEPLDDLAGRRAHDLAPRGGVGIALAAGGRERAQRLADHAPGQQRGERLLAAVPRRGPAGPGRRGRRRWRRPRRWPGGRRGPARRPA